MTLPAVSNIKQAIAGGFERAYAYVLSSDGYALGQAATLAKGAACGQPYRIKAPKNANIAIPKPDIEYALSDVVEGGILFAPATLPNFDMGAAVVDLDFDALVQKFTNYLMGNMLMSLLQPSSFDLLDMALVFMRRAKAKQGSISGASMWEGVTIPKCNIYPTGATDITARKIADYGYWVLTNPSSSLPNGQDIPTQFVAVAETTAPIIPWTAPNKMILIPWIGDGATLVFNLPKSVAKLVDNTLNTGPTSGGRNTVTNEGVLVTTNLTIDITSDPQTLTFTVAPTDNHRIELWAEIQ